MELESDEEEQDTGDRHPNVRHEVVTHNIILELPQGQCLLSASFLWATVQL